MQRLLDRIDQVLGEASAGIIEARADLRAGERLRAVPLRPQLALVPVARPRRWQFVRIGRRP